MDVYEIAAYETGISEAGVNYLQPVDSFQNMINGFIYRQVLQSRQGFGYFAPRLNPTPPGIVPITNFRVYGIFEYIITRTNTTELLVTDANFLYKYNIATGVFDQIPFGGSMAAYDGFQLTEADSYISGTTYPDANNNSRFVFCGEGITPNANGSSIFFYDGTSVLDYTNVADNINYIEPPQGKLSNATYVLWFNERINFIIPIIAGIDYQQGFLYSGIRTVSGNGDNFNVAGSGLFQADTYQYITGATILGQFILVNFNRMAYTMEKTRDAFNPYFGRAIPGPLGTDAKFSANAWGETIRSLGKTGILGTDGRQNLRVDNKIPYFTARSIDQVKFNMTYGGFDRTNNQFLWSYPSQEDLDTQDAVLVGNYEENSWSVYTQRFSVLGQTDVGLNLTWEQIEDVAGGNESWSSWDTTSEIWDRIGLGQSVQKTLAGDNLGFIYELNSTFDDYFSLISNITQGATTTLTVTETGILAGDLVTIEGVNGMLEADGVTSGINNYDPDGDNTNYTPWLVLSATPTSIEINLDSTNLTAYIPVSGAISKVISFSAETIPFNPYRADGRRCYISHVDFIIDCNGGALKVDVYADQDDTPFIRDVLCQPTVLAEKESEIVSMSINQEATFFTFALKQELPHVQLKLTSMKLYCAPGGYING